MTLKAMEGSSDSANFTVNQLPETDFKQLPDQT